MLTPQEVRERLEQAFLPHLCETELLDYEYKIKFRITDVNSKWRTALEPTPLHKLQGENDLKSIIAQFHERVKAIEEAKTPIE